MAVTEKKNEAVYVTLEELKKQFNTPDAVFEGMKSLKNWREGKQVTEAEYKKAVKEFENAPADGRGAKR